MACGSPAPCGAAVQAILDLTHFFRRDPGQAGALREVLAHQAIGVLVQAPLPGVARSRKAEPRLQPGGDLPVTGELLAAVRSQGAHPAPVHPPCAAAGLQSRAPRPCWPGAPGW